MSVSGCDAVGQVGVGVQVTAQVRLGDQGGQLAALGGLDLPAVLAQRRRDPRQPQRLVHLLLGGGGEQRPLSAAVPESNRPYSDSFWPRWMAISRSLTLCACDPVKYSSAAPQLPSGTTRRSAWIPSAVRIEVLASPLAITSAASGSSRNAAISAAGSAATARMSTSPMVSRIRRSEPA